MGRRSRSAIYPCRLRRETVNCIRYLHRENPPLLAQGPKPPGQKSTMHGPHPPRKVKESSEYKTPTSKTLSGQVSKKTRPIKAESYDGGNSGSVDCRGRPRMGGRTIDVAILTTAGFLKGGPQQWVRRFVSFERSAGANVHGTEHCAALTCGMRWWSICR